MIEHPIPFAVDPSTPRPRRFIRGVVAVATLGVTFGWAGGPVPTAHAAIIAINQCNGDVTGAAREIICTVTVVNNIDLINNTTTSTVTTTVCAGAPGTAATSCVTTPGAPSTDLVGSVNQCNDSVIDGGSIVTCNVSVVNNIAGIGSTSPASVNQCIGSGGGGGTEPTMICSPLSSVSGADITQCNGSGNGGGATARVQCTVLTSTVSSLSPVSINQCNNSAYGGGDLVTCGAQITTNILSTSDTTPTALPGIGSRSRGLSFAILVTALGALAIVAARVRFSRTA